MAKTGCGKRHYSSFSSSGDSSEGSSIIPTQQVQVSTFDKWKRGMDRQYDTLTWLCCEVDKKNRSLVSSIYFKVCGCKVSPWLLFESAFSKLKVVGSHSHVGEEKSAW